MTSRDRNLRARADWLKAEAAYRDVIEQFHDGHENAPTKDDYIAIAQARARADHKQATYFRDVLRG